MSLIITIDGPAGAGKSTLARALAKSLGWIYLDTGAMYRAVGLAVSEAGIDESDEPAVTRLMTGLQITVAPGQETTRVFLGDREVTRDIRQPHISQVASRVSAYQAVREAMVILQRQQGAAGRLVAEGRDMGTVVFPQAILKFFLVASPAERARRRYGELTRDGLAVDLERISSEIEARDRADASRVLAPLRPAAEAVLIDSTGMEVPQVRERMLAIAKARLPRDAF